jgi:hypothetical protein
MNENDLSYLIRGAAFKVHTAFGPGILKYGIVRIVNNL